MFSGAAILSYTDRQVLSLLVDPLRADLHITDSEVGVLQGLAFALIYSIAGLPLGRLADVVPRRLVIIVGVLIWSLGTLACGLAPNFVALFGARVLVGVGEAALAPAAISMISDLFPPNRRGVAIGVFLMGMTVGGGIAITLGGLILQAANEGLFKALPLIGAMHPWRAALVLLSLPGPIIAAILLTVREPARRNVSGSKAPGSLAASLAGFRLRAGVLVPLYFAMALVSIGDNAIGAWSPSLLSRRFAMPPGQIGILLGGAAVITGVIGTVVGGLIADRLVKRGGPARRLTLAFAASAIGVVGGLIGFAVSGGQVVALFALWALMSAVAGSIGITAVQEIVSNEMRGLSVAINSFGNILIGVVGGTSLTAFVTDYVLRSPLAVGWSITAVTVPVGIVATGLFLVSYRNLVRRGAFGDTAADPGTFGY